MSQRLLALFLTITLTGFATISLSAGTVTTSLQDRISTPGADQGEFYRVVIVPVSDFNPAAMKASLKRAYQTRAERHREGIARLKAVAEQSQVSVKSRLNGLEKQKLARGIKSYWITNLIEADMTAEAITQLAADPAIEKIDLYPVIASIPTPVGASLTASIGGVEDNLKTVRADSAWQLGFDGRGRLVCNFDTGVDGDHPALINNYRGNKGYDPAQCWFSPTDSSTFPHYFPTAGLSAFHGSHTMGIIVGHDDATGDTIGVAPGADWIAAVAIDVPGSSIFEAFQWAADPDGDPNTVTDLPDVINHSWGLVTTTECFDMFWDLIDNIEALGVVNVFSAGNSGAGLATILSPASRALDSLTNFAVGYLDTIDFIIGEKSSRGPSPCDMVSTKPNVVAPGTEIRSSLHNGSYGYASGTSMAAPHVAGAVAILRQKNPDATVDQIKTALLNSSRDLGAAGPDNVYGWGLIDIVEALKQIDLLIEPSLQIEELAYPEILPGDAVQLDLALKNAGAPTDGVYAEFSNPEPGVTIVTPVINFGKISSNHIVYGDRTLDLLFDAAIETGKFYSLDMNIYDDGGPRPNQRLSFFVGGQGQRTYFHHESGRVKFTISNYGAYGFYGTSGSYIPLGFLGFKFDRDVNDMYEGAFLIGTDADHVSDCARNYFLEPDNDFAVPPGGSITSSSPGTFADQETASYFNDSYAENPMGLFIEQHTYGWASEPDDKFIILEYIISNTSGGNIGGVRAGLFFDWDINFGANHGNFQPDENIGYLCRFSIYPNNDSADFRGVKILNPEGLSNHRIFEYEEFRDGNLSEQKKYLALSDSFINGTRQAAADYAHVTATGPFNLNAGESDTAVFAIIAGATWDEFMEAAVLAQQKYDIVTDADDSPPPLPKAFTLHQNYPNPFNPATTISFTLPRSGEVRLEIFNILGRKVKILHDGRLPAGERRFVWDGTDDSGITVAGGIYLYRVRFDNTSLARKMLLLK